nr:HNH endonuclease family protein [Motilibacter peucedani]
MPLLRRRALAVALASGVALLLGGCDPRAATAPQPPQTSGGSALGALAALATARADAVVPTYRRDRFGDGWADLDHDGCGTRQEVLRRDLRDVRFRAGTAGCTVESGVLDDPYSGEQIRFRYGPSTSDDVQIDHVVALADAWRTGASSWTDVEREQFANDPLELLAVDGPLNQAKSSKDAARWLPPEPAARCTYVARQVAVKRRYLLAVTARERVAMQHVLEGCPGEGLPGPADAAVPRQ